VIIPYACPLIEALAEIPDFRKARGRRHPLPSILALACCAVRCGYRSYSAMAEWGHIYGPRFTRILGFRGQRPSAVTLHTIFKGLDVATFEATRGGLGSENHRFALAPRVKRP